MKIAARLLILLGAVGIALLLQRSNPRDVELVYDMGEIRDATALDARIEKGGELMRRAQFPLSPDPGMHVQQVREKVRLTTGEYHVRVELTRPGAILHTDRTITVTESQTIVIPVGP